MTFLTAARSASIRLGVGGIPQTFFSSNGLFEQEICDLGNELVGDIVRRRDWRKLTKLQSYTGDGTTVGFDLPSDLDHFPKGMKVHQQDWTAWNFIPAADLNEWLNYVNGLPNLSPGAWIILDGQMQFQPPLEVGQVAQFYYISANAVDSQANGLQPTFTADSDTFLYDESLITLGLIWMWKAMKGRAYEQDFQNFENKLEEVSGQEKGSTILIVGNNRWKSNYPWRPYGLGW